MKLTGYLKSQGINSHGLWTKCSEKRAFDGTRPDWLSPMMVVGQQHKHKHTSNAWISPDNFRQIKKSVSRSCFHPGFAALLIHAFLQRHTFVFSTSNQALSNCDTRISEHSFLITIIKF